MISLTFFGPVVLLLILMGAMFLTVSATRLASICFKWAALISLAAILISMFHGRLP